MPRCEIVRHYNVDGILDSLTDLQRRFVLAYIECENITEAYAKTGSKSQRPDVQGAKILKLPKVQKALGELRRRSVERGLISVEDTLQQLQFLVTRTAADFIDADGFTRPVHEMSPRAQACIDGWKEKETIAPDGTRTVHRQVKLSPKAVAIDMAMRKFGEYAPQKVEAAVANVNWEDLWKQARQAELEDTDHRLKRLEAELTDSVDGPDNPGPEGVESTAKPEVCTLSGGNG